MKHISKYLIAAGIGALVLGAYIISQRPALQTNKRDVSQSDVVSPAPPGGRQGMGNGPGPGMMRRDTCVADECLEVADVTYPVGTLPDTVKQALDRAYADEYHAHEFYEAVIGTYGSVRPFAMIIRSEQMHMASLQALYDKYSVTIPTSPSSEITPPISLTAACAEGVKAEKANVALYDEQLLPQVSAYPDITTVFIRLRDASQDRHLPAFTRCAS